MSAPTNMVMAESATKIGLPATDDLSTNSGPFPSTPRRLPRVLFTGFSVFPGAPLNPTERLLPLLADSYRSGLYSDLCSTFSTEIFPVEYEALPSRLSALAKTSTPDIVVHFGLDQGAMGIKLERFARNECGGHPDNAGYCMAGSINEGEDAGAVIPSRLPLEEINEELQRRGIVAGYSDDAGGYLCNCIFYLSASKSDRKPCPEWMPEMVGFVHVPKLREGRLLFGLPGMEMEVMKDAAEAILEVCCWRWMEVQRGAGLATDRQRRLDLSWSLQG